jgi:hypothetical protein
LLCVVNKEINNSIVSRISLEKVIRKSENDDWISRQRFIGKKAKFSIFREHHKSPEEELL